MPENSPSTGAAQAMPGPSLNFLMILLVFTLSGLAIQLGLLEGSGVAFVFVMAGWVLSLCLHEFAHAFVAWKGGDHEIAETGYLSLDPRHYVDPMFSIVMPVLFTFLGGIGFPGGSVLINRHLLRSPLWQSGVSAAGPAMNLAFLLALLAVYALASPEAETLRAVLAISALFQATTIVLNLLPIPGLDGYGILRPFLPDSIRDSGDVLAGYSGLVLTALFLLSGAFSRLIFGAGLQITTTLGFAPMDVIAGYRLIRLW